jgi:hypothetical protein
MSEKTTDLKKFTLITGFQNSGKSKLLLERYNNEPPEKSYLIDVEMPVSEWVNESHFNEILEQQKEAIKNSGRKMTNRIKMEILIEYLQDKKLFLDNVHRATAAKAPAVKKLLLNCNEAVMTALDEGQISISLRDVILGEEPKQIRLKAKGKYLPTFDITPIIFGCLIITAFATGHFSAGYILAGIATITFRMRAAKQS